MLSLFRRGSLDNQLAGFAQSITIHQEQGMISGSLDHQFTQPLPVTDYDPLSDEAHEFGAEHDGELHDDQRMIPPMIDANM